ncbi:MAG: DUF86 domain-containing protein [Candidatus Micrarchaeota archaeon]
MFKALVYLDDILNCVEKIERYTTGLTYEEFISNDMVADAVIRNLEIIGEAVKNLPAEVKKEYSDIEWRKIAGLRDILIHEYFGINLLLVWDIIKNKLPSLKTSVQTIRNRL